MPDDTFIHFSGEGTTEVAAIDAAFQVNADTGYTGPVLDAQVNSVSQWSVDNAGIVNYATAPTQTTAPTAGAAAALPATPAVYFRIRVAGTLRWVPAY